MYRILVVDDDAIVVEGLVQLLSAHYGEEVDLCKAFGSDEATEMIRKTKLDLVISDIDMPGRNGLDMADEITRYWPKCRIVFLTGFSDFNYIYTAMKKRADHFVLKTENDEHLLAIIQSVLDELKEERKNQDMMRHAHSELQYLRPLLTREWLQALLEQPEMERSLSTEVNDKWNIDAGKPFMLLAGYVRQDEHVFWEKKVQTYGLVLNVFEELLPRLLLSNGFVTDDSVFVWLIQPRAEDSAFTGREGDIDWTGIADYLRGSLEEIQNELLHLQELEMSFVFNRQPLMLASWKGEYQRLLLSVQRLMAGSVHLAIVDAEAPHGGNDMDRCVQAVHDYIEGHLGDDLSLVRIAEQVHLNPSYLSRYYKQATGRNLSEFITETRLQAAKRWMVEEGVKGNEVAFRLGFNSPSYFTTFFKKLTGQTPQEYRDAHVTE
ncbi:response regulator [Paenibacillus sp. J5C_2022]|uniref:response regulator transcription factor n=1 Tax=Paenibacillus sp. J5C2022 TaxID=2977129 RepID=UPI0021D1522C|nr:response regulator [Paenibacillus sp. J5C2022]MCU6712633.1 response regulator [Paenibacillus sp. J5C2022]